MIDEEELKRSPTPNALMAMYHPEFRVGYQKGRQHYFQEKGVFTDKEFVACLRSVFEESVRDTVDEQNIYVNHAIGFLLGQASGRVIPRQPDDDRSFVLEEVFLEQVIQKYGTTGQALTDAIRQLWTLQDDLAKELDTDIFEQMLYRGIPTRCL